MVGAGGTGHGVLIWVEDSSRDGIEGDVSNQPGSLDPAPTGLDCKSLDGWCLGFGQHDELKAQLATGHQLLHELTVQLQLPSV